MSFLRLNHVSKWYGGLRVVQDFSLDVRKGEFVSLLGPSGCGKTTTLQMIAGFADVTEGTIELDGKDITHAKSNARGLGIVFQSYALFPHMTARQNVGFGLEMRKIPAAQRHARVEQALALVHLDKFAERYPRALSGGQRQRVALARALVIEPPVLLLDEPMSNLDAKLREEMQFELREIQRKVGTTTIMVTHDQAEAMSISDRVVVMEAGRITQVDTPLAVYEHPRTAFISGFVGKTNLLKAVIQLGPDGTCAKVGPLRIALPLQAPAEGPVILALRPEKITCGAPGAGRCEGKVAERFFFGNLWVYSVRSPMGELLVSAVNDGTPVYEIGQEVGLDWQDRNVRVIGAEETLS